MLGALIPGLAIAAGQAGHRLRHRKFAFIEQLTRTPRNLNEVERGDLPGSGRVSKRAPQTRQGPLPGSTSSRCGGRRCGIGEPPSRKTACCYAVQDKVWGQPASAPSPGVYVVNGDADTLDKPSELRLLRPPTAKRASTSSPPADPGQHHLPGPGEETTARNLRRTNRRERPPDNSLRTRTRPTSRGVSWTTAVRTYMTLVGSHLRPKRAGASAPGASEPVRVQSVTLIITCKGPEGLALAADSRATITVTTDSGDQSIAYVDTATKLFALADQPYVGLLAWGEYFFGNGRSIAGAIPELEMTLAKRSGDRRLTVAEVANEVSAFFAEQWRAMR